MHAYVIITVYACASAPAGVAADVSTTPREPTLLATSAVMPPSTLRFPQEHERKSWRALLSTMTPQSLQPQMWRVIT
jgi:hypothetical protein